MTQPSVVLEVENLSIHFSQYKKALTRSSLHVLHDLSVTVREREVVAVVGSSGSGKSLLAHAIMGVLPYNATVSGTIRYRDEALTASRLKALRGKELVLVPQSVSFLDPLQKVGPQVSGRDRSPAAREKTVALLGRYGLEERTANLYPFELSGGMARRVLIATALMDRPGLVIADEPTPGLHQTAAKRVLGHFREIADEGAGVLLITHDLELAMLVADRIVVFYAGTTVEDAAVQDFQREDTLRHPYTRALWRAMPQNGFQSQAGTQPYAGDQISGCPYAPRCPHPAPQCAETVPYRPFRGGFVRCICGEEE